MRSNRLSERDQWINIKKNIDTFAYNEFWEQGFELFKNRIYTKFINPLDNIINLKNNFGEGFAIVSLQCSLIETFAAFKLGKIFNPRFNEQTDPAFQYKDSRELFVTFLHSEEIFENHFYIMNNGQKVIDNPFNANEFYSNVRCALVHEGKTRKTWTINLKPKNISEHHFIKEVDGKKKIYRTFLQKSLKQYLDDYLQEIREPLNENGRKYFGRKMDNTFELRRNNNINWWQE